MASTDSAPALLRVALQDLHAGKVDQAKRLPGLADKCRDPALTELVRAEASGAAAHAAAINDAGVDTSGPANLWMAGILDDAERDGKQTQPGRLLDVALVGAIRKGKAAEIVSFETAMALARMLGTADLLAMASGQRADAIATDRRLAERLAAIAGAAPAG